MLWNALKSKLREPVSIGLTLVGGLCLVYLIAAALCELGRFIEWVTR